MPDISILPLLADFFNVSTDQLLGLKPLDGETYFPEKTSTKDCFRFQRSFRSPLLEKALSLLD